LIEAVAESANAIIEHNGIGFDWNHKANLRGYGSGVESM
jgi:hypothetical protein